MRRKLLLFLPALLLLVPSVASGQTANIVPAVLDFGTVQIGGQQTLQVAITSGEATPLEIFSITITEDPSSAFEITAFDPDPIPAYLLQSESVTVDIRFTAVSSGSHAGVMRLHSNDHDEEYIEVPLAGTGVAPGTTYRYTGNPFTSVFGDYTTNDRITGAFTVATPLAANLVNSDVTSSVVAYSFTDDVQTFTEATPGVTEVFLVSTNANGDIIERWNVSLTLDANHSMHTRGDGAASNDFGGNASLSFGGVSGAPGTWQTIAAPGVPSLGPAALAMLVTAMVGAALLAQRAERRRPGL